MAKNVTGIEKGDILVAMGKVYIYSDPEDAALDKEYDFASEGVKFGVATGVTKKGKDGFSYTEMVIYLESSKSFDLTDKKYYVLQSTYNIEENPDYDYSLNKKKTLGSVATGVGNGFNKFVDLLSGIFGIVQSQKDKKDTNSSSSDSSNNDGTDTTSNNDTGTQETWFQKNKFVVILGGFVFVIIGITVYIGGKNKKKKMEMIQKPLPTTAA